MGARGRSRRIRERAGSGLRGGCPGKTKTEVVVRFIRIVPVTVRRDVPTHDSALVSRFYKMNR